MMGNNNKALNNTAHNVYRGISSAGTNNTIAGNIIFNITGGYGEGNDGTNGGEAAIVGSFGTIIANNTIYDCKLNESCAAIIVSTRSNVYGNIINITNKDCGIQLSGIQGINDIIINDNIINNGKIGIYVVGYMDNVTIINNNINLDSGVGISFKRQSSVKFITNVTIINNTILTSNIFINSTEVSNPYICENNTFNKIAIVTKDNFNDYFDSNGCLKDFSNFTIVSLIFSGEFIDLPVNTISINKSLNISGLNSNIKDIQFNISGNDVIMNNINLEMTINKPAITLNNVTDFNLIKSNIVVFSDNPALILSSSYAYLYSNIIHVNNLSPAILANYKSQLIASVNFIKSTGQYSINLSDSGDSSSENLKNNVSNNCLVSHDNVGDSSIYFNEGLENNSIIQNNTFYLQSEIIIIDKSIFINSNYSIKLINSLGEGIPNCELIIILTDSNNYNYTYLVNTSDDGVAILNLNCPVGNYIVSAIFNGSEMYNSTSTTSSLEIKYIDTSLIVSDVELEYGEDILIKVYLKGDNASINLDGKEISLTVNGSTYVSTTNDGLALFKIKTLPLGTHIINYLFKGDEDYSESNATSNITVNQASSIIEAKNMVVLYDDGSKLLGYLKTKTGKGIAKQPISIVFAGKTYSLTTDSQGKFSLNIGKLVPKTYIAKISYINGTEYSSASKTVTVQVKTRTTKIIASSLVKYYGTSNPLVAYLKDINNKPIASKTVSININGKIYKKTTDKNGKVSLSINLPVKSYKTTFKFSAPYYGSSSKVVTLKMVKPTIKAVNPKVKKGKKLSVVFKNAYGSVISYEKVYFNFKGKKYNAVTNAKGIITLLCNINKANYSLVAGFRSTATYGTTKAVIKFSVV